VGTCYGGRRAGTALLGAVLGAELEALDARAVEIKRERDALIKALFAHYPERQAPARRMAQAAPSSEVV
jgi:hypothetical protein